MKSSRGVTFIEVITSLMVLSILLPVVGIVFYHLFTTPPEQSARLTLNNEVMRLSQYLYNDAHIAENFSLPNRENGSQYYGNFTWVDYTTIPPKEHLISYYATCPNASNTSCVNSIVRQDRIVNASNASATPTPTPTTPTPTPTPGIPASETYTFCAGYGESRFAWEKAWNSTEWATRPTNPLDFSNDSSRSLNDAGISDYQMLCYNDSSSWGFQESPPANYVANSQLFQFTVQQNRSEVTNLSVAWRGFGGSLTYNTKLKIWNYNSGAWSTLVSTTDPGSKVIDTYTNEISTNPSYYIESGTNLVTMLASSDIGSETPRDINFNQSLMFNGSRDLDYGNYVTTSSTGLSNTFTLEAWVKAANPHEIDAEASSGTLGVDNQCYVFWPEWGGPTDAGAGLSVGTNGISVYEHGDGYMPALAVYQGSLGTAWNHIAIVYNSKQPSIYLNGNLVKTGLASPRGNVTVPLRFGNGSYGGFNGTIDEIRIWNVALNSTQIKSNMYQEIGTDSRLKGYWRFNGNASDSSGNGHDGTLSPNPPQYIPGVQRDLTVYTDYLGLTVNTPGPTPTPTPTVPPPTPETTQVAFTTVGTTTWTPPLGVSQVDNVLVVGGGGAGGGTINVLYYCGGGGGAGGLIYRTNFSFPETYIVTYTSSGTWTVPANVTSVEVLVVGGGGGGGSGNSYTYACGGGGGAGGLRYNPSFSVTPGATITVTVGGGGNGGAAGGANPGANGGDSAFGTLTASGGGGGAYGASNGVGGGSGGGGGVRTSNPGSGGAGTAGQGNNGGNGYQDGTANRNAGGGGGGNGSIGGNAASQTGGNGGSGADYNAYFGAVGGAGGWFAGGGGGGCFQKSSGGSGSAGGGNGGGEGGGCCGNGEPGSNAASNTGSGGGGGVSGGWALSWNNKGGNGGSGIVVIKYSTSTLTVTVGDGGSGTTGKGGSGGYSQFGSLQASGGGGGGRGTTTGGEVDALSGGSGGGGGGAWLTTGSSGSGTGGQGNSGGSGHGDGTAWYDAGGGGGGNGSTGTAAGHAAGGAGGAGGNYSNVFGTGVGASGWFAGGGGGAGDSTSGAGGQGGGGAGAPSRDGVPGTDGTGGGGGGAYTNGDGQKTGGEGGSGIVIIKYKKEYKSLYTSASTGGTVSPAPPGANYTKNSNVSINATAYQCYYFVNWTGTGVTAGKVNNASNPNTFITMSDNYSVQANFAPVTTNYSLTLTPSPGEASGSPSFTGTNPFPCGFNVSISANPNTGWYFAGWSPTAGVANASAADTTVQMTQDRSLTAYYNTSPTPTPSPTPRVNESTSYLTYHITTANFSLTQSGEYIVANMTAGVSTNFGEYIEKRLTTYILPRPIYLLPEEDFWGDDTFVSTGGLRFSGTYSTISGDVKVNGTVTVVSSAYNNIIDGTLTCPNITWPTPPGTQNLSKLNFRGIPPVITQRPNLSIPELWPAQQYFTTNLTTGTTDWAKADELHEYVFTGDVNLRTNTSIRDHIWVGGYASDHHTLKPGLYYSPGTITLEDHETRGSVTFIAGNKIIISNDDDTSGELIKGKIMIVPYYNDLLCWANGSTGTPTGNLDGDICIREKSGSGAYWHACASLEGVLYAPNGEIELAGSGRTGWMGLVDCCELYSGVLMTQNLTISGNYWNFYRW